MADANREELVSVEDIFENDELVLMKATFKPTYDKIVRTSVGVKDEKGISSGLLQLMKNLYNSFKIVLLLHK